METTVINDTFSLGRFGHELRATLQDKRKELVPYAISTIILIAIFAVSNLFQHADMGRSMWGFTGIIYFIILCMCVGVSSRAFFSLNTVNGALTELTTPSSQLEKFLARWLVSVALPLAFCIVIMKGVEIVAIDSITYYYTNLKPSKISHLEDMKMTYSFTASWLIVTVWLQAIFFLGSAGWKKYSQLKTIAVLTLMFILTVAVCGGYMPFLKATYSRTLTILLITLIPTCLYCVAWVMYRRAQVK